jgi:hypothetical protein
VLEFDGWNKTLRHIIVIYTDFETILVKCKERKGEKTSDFQKHEPMTTHGFVVKTTESAPFDLLEKFNLPQ